MWASQSDARRRQPPSRAISHADLPTVPVNTGLLHPASVPCGHRTDGCRSVGPRALFPTEETA